MPKIKPYFVDGDRSQPVGYSFLCPGCGDRHSLPVRPYGERTIAWTFNGNVERPTFSPSLLVRSGHCADGKKEHCWCQWEKEHPGEKAPFTCYVCHSFIADGRIQFLGDCTHKLAGQTVELPEIV